MEWLENYTDGSWVFRGQGALNHHKLQPSIGRPKDKWTYDPVRERQLLADFIRKAAIYEPGVGFTRWDWLALGQHYELPTRLLDWSDNPLVALWFALAVTQTEANGDFIPVVVLALKRGTIDDLAPVEQQDPLHGDGLTELMLVRPPSRAARITNQRGAFTWHRHPDKAIVGRFSEQEGNLFTIPGNLKAEFRSRLALLGVDEAHVMPDLGGLARSLRWRNELGLPLGTKAD